MRHVFIDPDGTCHAYLAVIVAHPTGVTYWQQCSGTATEDFGLEGYLVPIGGARFDPEQGRVSWRALAAVFHPGCSVIPLELPTDRLEALRRRVAAIPFWTRTDGGEDVRGHLVLDESRLAELREAWVPVITPDGPGILTWPNCD